MNSLFASVLGFLLLLQVPAERVEVPVGLEELSAVGLHGGNPTGCSSESWAAVLDLGLRADLGSEEQLIARRDYDHCAEIRKLAEILLKDRKSPLEILRNSVSVWVPSPDWEKLNLREEISGGAVLLEVTINEEGRVSDAVSMRTTGDARIDDLCLETARTWLFRPARGTKGFVSSKKIFTIRIEVR